ncbi:MFS transporter [Actinophytocola algeriensis]|uniref:MFS family permease n=1 Tax=Actinophytocola algeriensis TaxID=1768010 RepID=A0A7W7QFK2_9PSEU|nr:MFS transporter [Actinophytocola algeriensis]MBB4912603.1 MFS family permease [Actinophytocola algeriensis]MBE1478977.1 MFS family permease [Actinophytocola algeriensis]
MADRWGLVVAASLAIFVAQLDATIVNVALPSIADAAVGQWVVLGYLMPIIGLALCAGRWVDASDPGRALRLACLGFAVFTVACGLSPSVGWLIAARVGQGVFAVVLLALAPMLTTVAVAPARRARAFGISMLFGTAGGMTGPVLGGWLVESFGWPWIFYVTVPVLVAIVVLSRRSLPVGDRLAWPSRRWLAEAATFGGGAASVLLGLLLSPWLLVGAVLLVVWWRGAASAPVRALLSTRGVLGPHVALVFVYTGLFLVTFLVPFFLRDPSTAGLVLLAFPVSALVTAYGAGLVADRVGTRVVALCGAGVIAAGLASLVVATAAPEDLAWRLALAGAGFGLFNGQVQVFLMGNAPREWLGVTAATSNLVRQVGIAAGSATGAALWSLAGDASALRTGFAVALGLTVLCGATLLRSTAKPLVSASPGQ